MEKVGKPGESAKLSNRQKLTYSKCLGTVEANAVSFPLSMESWEVQAVCPSVTFGVQLPVHDTDKSQATKPNF